MTLHHPVSMTHHHASLTRQQKTAQECAMTCYITHSNPLTEEIRLMKIWIFRFGGFPAHFLEWRGLRLLTWNPVWNVGDSRENVFDMYGDSCGNLLEILAVDYFKKVFLGLWNARRVMSDMTHSSCTMWWRALSLTVVMRHRIKEWSKCQSHGWGMSCVRMSHGVCINAACHAYECVMSLHTHTHTHTHTLTHTHTHTHIHTHTHTHTHTTGILRHATILAYQVTHMNQSCHTHVWMSHAAYMYEWVMPHTCMKLVTHTLQSSQSYEGVMHMPIVCMRHATYKNESCHIYTCMRRVTHMNTSRYPQEWPVIQLYAHAKRHNVNEFYCTHERSMSLPWMSHTSQIKESCQSYEWVVSRVRESCPL